ncbi:MAG: hypothetical protein H6744_00530 [Deltaproteobacteria bacterium]|nr:hypothetical protein [Deltaproteobacteria bacterium]MCB9785151.1 hypothetical protein [Deltaproteobacteria bacterium]
MIPFAQRVACTFLALSALACPKSPAMSNPDVPPPPAPARTFDCAAAADTLGHPGAKVEQCRELFPRFFRVVLSGGDFPPDHHEVYAFVWDKGRRSTATGYAALASYMKQASLLDLGAIDPWSFSVLLDALEAVPPGFAGADLTGHVGDLRGGLTLKPFVATLVRGSYRPQGPADPNGPPLPPGGVAQPPGGPPGVAPPPPGQVPGPGGVPMPGGLIGRATLTADRDYHFVWTVETRQAPGQPWTKVSTEPF